MTTDAQIETEIQAKGKTAPRITPADIEANIVNEVYFTAADGIHGANIAAGNPIGQIPNTEHTLLTFCVLVLRNGFTVTGESACASPENFDAEIGRKVARSNAVNKIWPLLGFQLKTDLHGRAYGASSKSDDNDFPLGKACDMTGEGTCEACQ